MCWMRDYFANSPVWQRVEAPPFNKPRPKTPIIEHDEMTPAQMTAWLVEQANANAPTDPLQPFTLKPRKPYTSDVVDGVPADYDLEYVRSDFGKGVYVIWFAGAWRAAHIIRIGDKYLLAKIDGGKVELRDESYYVKTSKGEAA